MSKVTKDLILTRSRNSDLETVFCLTLSGLNLIELGAALHDCIHLEILYAENNRLSNLSTFDLTKFPRLRVLHLENNCITDLSSLRDTPEPLSIEKLYLQGNLIRDVDVITSLAPALPKLRTLHLQDLVDSTLDNNRSNPVCRTATYRAAIRKAFPNLVELDGERLLHPVTLQQLVADIGISYPLETQFAAGSIEDKDGHFASTSVIQEIQRYECELAELSQMKETSTSVDNSKIGRIDETMHNLLTKTLGELTTSLKDTESSLVVASTELTKFDARLAEYLAKLQ